MASSHFIGFQAQHVGVVTSFINYRNGVCFDVMSFTNVGKFVYVTWIPVSESRDGRPINTRTSLIDFGRGTLFLQTLKIMDRRIKDSKMSQCNWIRKLRSVEKGRWVLCGR